MLKVVDRWTTRDGLWEAKGRPYDIDPSHLHHYGGHDIPGKGGAAHLFVRAKVGSIVRFFTEDARTPQSEEKIVAHPSGWVNFNLWASSAYWGEDNGPWNVEVNGVRVARGLGLPEGLHVSTFLVVEDTTEQTEPQPVPGRDKIQVIVNGQVVWEN